MTSLDDYLLACMKLKIIKTKLMYCTQSQEPESPSYKGYWEFYFMHNDQEPVIFVTDGPNHDVTHDKLQNLVWKFIQDEFKDTSILKLIQMVADDQLEWIVLDNRDSQKVTMTFIYNGEDYNYTYVIDESKDLRGEWQYFYEHIVTGLESGEDGFE